MGTEATQPVGETDLAAIMAQLDERLKTLDEREAGGEDVSVERAEVEARRTAVEAEHEELDRLRAESADRRLGDEARSIAKSIHRETLDRRRQEEDELRKRVRSELEDLMRGDGRELVTEIALDQARNTRAGSRFVAPGADAGLVAHVAAGGEVTAMEKRISFGDDLAIKELEDSKYHLGHFVVAVAKKQWNRASDVEERWIASIQEKAQAEGTPSAGGYLIAPEWMDEILTPLRAMTIVRRAPGIREVPFGRLMNMTSISAGATAYYTAENAAIPTSELTFAETQVLTPKNLTALVPASNYLLNDAAQADSFIRNDIAEVLALKEDWAFLIGTGANTPTGFSNMAGIINDPLGVVATGTQASLATVRRLLATFRANNVSNAQPVLFFHPDLLTYFETLQEMSGGQPTGRLLVDTGILVTRGDRLGEGTFLGIPFFSSTQLPTATVGGNPTATMLIVDAKDAIIGMNQQLEVDVSSEASYTTDSGTTWVSAFQNNQSLFRAVMRHDIAHRRPTTGIIKQPSLRTT